MATSRITNTIKDASGTAIPSVPVQVRLMPSGGFRISDFTEVARLDSTSTDATGFWSLDLERNANITPANSWYEVTELVPDSAGGKRVWFIAVGDSDQSLLASLVTPAQQQPTVVPAGTVYLDQAAADARYQALGGLSAATPSAIDLGDTGTAGVSSSASRADHEHPALSGGTPVAIALDGNNAASVTTQPARIQHVHAYRPPTCRVFHNTTQNLAASTETPLVFNSERWDTDSMHSTSVDTGRITINTAGVYDIKTTIEISAGAGSWSSYIFFRVDGVTRIARTQTLTPDTLGTVLTLATTWKFTVGQYVEVVAWQNSGAETVISSASATPEFMATWIAVG